MGQDDQRTRWGPLRVGDCVLAVWTNRSAGDQRTLGTAQGVPEAVPPGLAVRRVNQLHGADVVVDTPVSGSSCESGPARAGARWPGADAIVSHDEGSCLAILTADCAAVALGSAEGVFGAVHVGWRGLVAGVVENAVGAMADLGASDVSAGLGPCIHPCCYRFEAPELDLLAGRYGQDVRTVTAREEPALDLPLAVRRALTLAGARVTVDIDRCTACGDDTFSYRARQDEQRQALLVWLDRAAR